MPYLRPVVHSSWLYPLRLRASAVHVTLTLMSELTRTRAIQRTSDLLHVSRGSVSTWLMELEDTNELSPDHGPPVRLTRVEQFSRDMLADCIEEIEREAQETRTVTTRGLQGFLKGRFNETVDRRVIADALHVAGYSYAKRSYTWKRTSARQ